MAQAAARTQRATEYFANLYGRELTTALLERFDGHISRLEKTRMMARLLRSWNTYYAFDPNTSGSRGGDTTSMRPGGRQGETTLIKTNRYRAILQRLLNMNAGSTPSWDCVALNTDSDSSRQARIGDNIIEHYGSSFKLFERLLERDEHAFVMAAGYIAAPWDYHRGPIYTYADEPVLDADGNPMEEDAEEEQQSVDPTTGETITSTVMVRKPVMKKVPKHAGDFRFLVLTMLDCATESYSEDRDRPMWAIYRYPVNKWDLAALYPRQREEILALDACSVDRSKLGIIADKFDDDDSVYVYEFHHAKTPACPKGRSVRFLRGVEEPLTAGPFQYKTIPVFRTAPGDIILQDGAHTPGFDVLQVSEARAAVLSGAIMNQSAATRQVIRSSKSQGLQPRNIGHMVVVEMEDSARFETVDFDSKLGDSIQLLDTLEREEDFVSSLNAAARGDAEAMKGDSGAKGALVLSAAQQMQTRFQRSRQLADSMLFTHIIDTLKTHATVERVIEIAGKANAYEAMTFIGSDIEGISRVYVHPANPLKDTPEGRAQLVEGYLKLGVIDTPEDLYMVATTGRLEHVEHEYTSQLTLIDQENETLADMSKPDVPVPVLPDDPHALHIQKHRIVMTSMALRTDPAAIQRYNEHVLEHRRWDAKMKDMGQDAGDPKPPSAKGKAEGAAKQAMGAGNAPTSQPDMPKAPINPANGQRAPIAPPPQLQAQVPTT